MVTTRSIARLGTLAVGLGIGAAWAHTPVASADTSSDWLSAVDSLFSGAAPAVVAPAVTDFQISFNGTDLFPTLGNEATATTVAGQFGLAIAFGDGASATAQGGIGNYALADGTDALAKAGSTAVGATGNNFNFAADIGNNPTTETVGAPDGAYAGGGSLIGSTDSATSSNNTAIDIGNNGLNPNLADQDGGNSGAFAGDGHLIGLSGAGNGDTAYTFGNINGANDGSAAVDGNSNSAYTNGTEIGQNEGAFAGLGNNNSATADVNYTHDGDGASAIAGNNNYAFVNGPDNSTADAGGTSTAIGDPATNLGNNDIAYVSDPFGAAGSPDGAVAGGGFSNDLAEVLFAHGNASADTANLLYDIVSLFGNFSGSL